VFDTVRNAFRIPDLRKKILYTLLILVIFRIGSVITVPFVNVEALKLIQDNSVLANYLNMFTGNAFSNATIFAMSISPYITASIVMQLLTVAIPPLERMQKEGEVGQKKITQITRVVTIVLGLMMGFGLYTQLRSKSGVLVYTKGWESIYAAVVIIAVFTAGTALIMWLGERINEKGIGNGISIILFAGIIAGFPQIIYAAYSYVAGDPKKIFIVLAFVVLFLAIIAVIVLMNDAERRIPVQYAKRVVGRKMYGGQSSHIPIKVNMSGVMPIIFASSLLIMPAIISNLFGLKEEGVWGAILKFFDMTSPWYSILYVLLILAFAFFYTTIQYNPIEMANNLRKNNGAIPGIRPGKPTSDFISKILSRITLIGAIMLAVIAVLPILVDGFANLGISLKGTSLIIVVGVALETVKQLESQMLMRHYKGFLE
jgi:preprotein translocase subunit SecY